MTPITLPPDVYDALELSAEAHGGVGAGIAWESPASGELIPCCLLGHAEHAGIPRDSLPRSIWQLNDRAVHGINYREQAAWRARVSFQALAAELPLVRG